MRVKQVSPPAPFRKVASRSRLEVATHTAGVNPAYLVTLPIDPSRLRGGQGGGINCGRRINEGMAEPGVGPEAAIDPDDAVREDIRAKLRKMNAPKVDRPKRKRDLTKGEEAAIGPTLFSNPSYQ